MPNPTTITKQEALRRLAVFCEKPGGEHYPYVSIGEMGSSEPVKWNPFLDLHDAFELQARLTDEQKMSFCDLLQIGMSPWCRWNLANATADQRTRAIVLVLWGVEVEE